MQWNKVCLYICFLAYEKWSGFDIVFDLACSSSACGQENPFFPPTINCFLLNLSLEDVSYGLGWARKDIGYSKLLNIVNHKCKVVMFSWLKRINIIVWKKWLYTSLWTGLRRHREGDQKKRVRNHLKSLVQGAKKTWKEGWSSKIVVPTFYPLLIIK